MRLPSIFSTARAWALAVLVVTGGAWLLSSANAWAANPDATSAAAPLTVLPSRGGAATTAGALAANPLSMGPATVATPLAAQTGDSGLSMIEAVVLGVVEGVTEYLPVSSTGHLLVTQRALDIADEPSRKTAADAYAIAIQFGAIVAVLVLYWRRLLSVLRGIFGRDPQGRRVALALVASFVPAIVLGVLAEQYIKNYLFAIWPIIGAWLVGGLVILAVAAWERRSGHRPTQGAALEDLSVGRAFGIGVLQCVAMWPGVSRSLVTILGGRLVGLSTAAAVEYSFLLGFVTLTAATVYETIRDGQEMVATLGVAAPVVGVVAAFISAALAVKWMVGYLNRHSLAIFGWYRLAVGVVAAALVLAGVL